MNALDRIIGAISPAALLKREKARAELTALGAYTGVDYTRRANQYRLRSREMDADSAILPDLSALREECQHLNRNNCLAGGAIKTNITKVVGTGLKVKSQIDREILNLTEEQADAWERAAEREFRLATESREIDIERQMPFSLLQALAFLKVLEDGDLLVNLPRIQRSGSPYKLKIQLIEAARLCNKERTPDTDRLKAGVIKDYNGAPVAYQVCSIHPGAKWRDPKVKATWTELKAFMPGNGPLSGTPLCLLLMDKTRPGQTRGVPYLAPVIELIKQLGKYTDAEVMAAVVSGMFTAFVTNEAADPTIGSATTEDITGNSNNTTAMELGPGSIIGLAPGEKIDVANPGRPNTAFDPFVMAIVRQIGAALEIPFELLVKHFTASYSAARAALEEAWDYFQRRRHWLVNQFCQPVYEAIITEAILSGRLSAPGFLSDPLVRKAWLGTEWTGDAPSQLDPMKEINAAAARVQLRISTRAEECAKLTGGDWERKLPQMIKEDRLLRENELIAELVDPNQPADPNINNGSDLETK